MINVIYYNFQRNRKPNYIYQCKCLTLYITELESVSLIPDESDEEVLYRQKSQSGDAGASFTAEEGVEAIGFGLFQIRLYVICGLFTVSLLLLCFIPVVCYPVDFARILSKCREGNLFDEDIC